MLIVNATLLIAGAFHSGKSVLIREGRIAEIGDSLSAAPDEPLVDFHGDVLLPGFVDVHIHGYRGTDTMRGETDIFIKPGYRYQMVDALITNFHLPGSTLLMLVSALYDREHILEVYNTAVKDNYRFFSF